MVLATAGRIETAMDKIVATDRAAGDGTRQGRAYHPAAAAGKKRTFSFRQPELAGLVLDMMSLELAIVLHSQDQPNRLFIPGPKTKSFTRD